MAYRTKPTKPTKLKAAKNKPMTKGPAGGQRAGAGRKASGLAHKLRDKEL